MPTATPSAHQPSFAAEGSPHPHPQNGAPARACHILAASEYRWALLGLGCSVLLFTLDLSIVNVALPTLVKELHTDFTTIQWVVLSYLLVVAAFLSAAARAGDLFCKKKLYMRGLELFTLGSLFCALANSVYLLIAARALQGLGAVLVSALSLAIVTEIAPPEKRGQAIGTVGGLISLGVAVGPSLGGLLVSAASWHWIFLVNVPIGVGSYLLLRRYLPSLEPAEKSSQAFDFPGMVGLAVWLMALDFGLNLVQRDGPGSSLARGLLIGSACMLVFLVVWERRHPSPLISLELFRNRTFTVGLVLALMVFVVLAGSLFLMPFFLENALGYGALKVGLLMAVAPVCGGLVAPLAGAWADRAGERPVTVVGLLLMAVGCFLISGFHQEMSAWRYVLAYLPYGLGIGIFQAPNNSSIMGGAPPQRRGTASGLLALSRTLGQSLGLPLMATIFTLVATGAHSGGFQVDSLATASLVQGIGKTFRGAAGLLVLAAAVAGVSMVGAPASARGPATGARAPHLA
jgi:EmrB/QacA subfamily drug resistance transporter